MKASNSVIKNNHHDRLIAFTTPENYASRLSPLIQQRGWTPIWCPTITTKSSSSNNTILHYLISSPPTPPLLNQFSALAFTSRSGISAFSNALSSLFNDFNNSPTPPLSSFGETFTICALGKDSERIDQTFIDRLCSKPNHNRINILVPQVATPAGLVESLGFGHGRKVLCPVPLVVGLEEPLVVPNFLRGLDTMGWVAVRVDAYETRWLGDECGVADKLVLGTGCCDAIVFTSTCEVQGLLKSLQVMGLDWGDVVKRNPGLVVAAHGPVTAAGAKSLGVNVDVVSKRFESFHGVVDALAHFWNDYY